MLLNQIKSQQLEKIVWGNKISLKFVTSGEPLNGKSCGKSIECNKNLMSTRKKGKKKKNRYLKTKTKKKEENRTK